MSPLHLALAFGCVTAGAAVQGTIGFGAALVSVPLLLLIDPGLVPGPALVAGLATNVGALAMGVGHVDWRGAGWAVVGLVPGTLAAGAVLAVAADTTITAASAGSVLAAVAASAAGARVPTGRRGRFGAGLCSGYLTATAAVGGPPLALAYRESAPATVRATLGAVLLVGTVLTMAMLDLSGELSSADWGQGLVLAPAGVIGVVAVRPLASRVDHTRLRTAVLAVSALSASVALAGAVA